MRVPGGCVDSRRRSKSRITPPGRGGCRARAGPSTSCVARRARNMHKKVVPGNYFIAVQAGRPSAVVGDQDGVYRRLKHAISSTCQVRGSRARAASEMAMLMEGERRRLTTDDDGRKADFFVVARRSHQPPPRMQSVPGEGEGAGGWHWHLSERRVITLAPACRCVRLTP
jgi:hypothetical protein